MILKSKFKFKFKSFLLSSSALVLGCTLSLTPVKAMEPGDQRTRSAPAKAMKLGELRVRSNGARSIAAPPKTVKPDEPRTGIPAPAKAMKTDESPSAIARAMMREKYPLTTVGNKALKYEALNEDDEKARDEMVLRYLEFCTTRYFGTHNFSSNFSEKFIEDPKRDFKKFLNWPGLKSKILNNMGYAWVLFHDFGAEYKEKFPHVVQAIQKSAEQDNNPIAQYTMGLMHQMGYGVEQSPAKAEEHYLMAAKQGHAPSQRELGIIYQPNNLKKATQWTYKAAAQGDDVARNNYAWMFSHDQGAHIKDGLEAVLWLRKAAEQRDTKALYEWGCKNIEIEPGLLNSMECLEMAAEQNYVPALFRLAEMYRDGKVVEKDPKKAIQLFRGVADHWSRVETDQNNPVPPTELAVAQTQLAFMLVNYPDQEEYSGEALELVNKIANFGANTPEEAAKWTLWAAELLHADAQRKLGVKYQPNDPKESENLIWKAIQQDDAAAQRDLGFIHYRINNPKEGLKWIQRAAAIRDQRSPDIQAVNFLAEIYRDGNGVEKDPKKAIQLFRIVADHWLHAEVYKKNPISPTLLAYMAQIQLVFMLLDFPETEQYPGEAFELNIKLSNCPAAKQYPEYNSALKSKVASFYKVDVSDLPNNLKQRATWAAAKNGNADAQYELGWKAKHSPWEQLAAAANAQDKEVFIDLLSHYPEAAKWFGKAAKQGHVYAQFDLAEMYRDGFDTMNANQVKPVNPPTLTTGYSTHFAVRHAKEAIQFFRNVIDHSAKGDQNKPIPREMALKAQIHLAFLLLNSPDEEKYSGEAMELANRAATEAHAHGLSLLNNPAHSAKWTLWPAELRHAAAMVQSQPGSKYQPFHLDALALLEHQLADKELVDLIEYEVGVMHFRFHDPEGGVKWIKRAAEKDNGSAQQFLSQLSRRQSFKVTGTQLNEGLTITDFEKLPQAVVEQGDALSQDDAGTLAELGSIFSDNVGKVFSASVLKDPAEKETLPQTAAEQDDGKIQAELDRLKLESKKKPK